VSVRATAGPAAARGLWSDSIRIAERRDGLAMSWNSSISSGREPTRQLDREALAYINA
jgi:hypothetical protein